MKQHLHRPNVILWFILSFLSLTSNVLFGQVTNDNCQFAIPIPSTDNYCSKAAEFTNIGAKADTEYSQGTIDCISLKWSNGVWFSFTPKQPAVLIRVLGSGNGGTMKSPKIVLFKRCGQYTSCSPGKDIGIDELVFDDLNIGQTYYIMVESAQGGEGTFSLCVDDFIPVKAPESDCRNAIILCDKTPFVINKLEGNGNDRQELDPSICVGGEFASAWYKWTCDVGGRLTFTLTPNNNISNQITDDIDFVLYELPNGINDCQNKKLLRCEGAGANNDAFGNLSPLSQWSRCNGPTGLREGETDVSEPGGCQGSNNNYVSPITMESGKSYALIINNFSRSGLGFSIEFGGTGTFLGPKPDFEINANQAFECDKSVVFTDKSVSSTDPIAKYTWSFGDRANPERLSAKGPHNVSYESFGNKIAALTVETSRGCLVTKIKEFYVNGCCKDTSTLALSASITDPICYNEKNGQILGLGRGGFPDLKYSLNGSVFKLNPLFANLDTGFYKLVVQDSKGCMDTLTDNLTQPPPIQIDAGPDQTIEFGDSTSLSGSYVSFNGKDSLFWTPAGDILINGINDPKVFPKTTTAYVFTLTDLNGCVKSDTVVIRVTKEYKLHAPNIISTSSAKNGFFNVWATKAVKNVEKLQVYDRWGNLVYDATNLKTNDSTSGWNGKFNDVDVVSGVYAWRAQVRFIDDVVKIFAGDVTVIR